MSACTANAAHSSALAPELALRITADAYTHLIETLRLALPPPAIPGAEALLRRDHAAIAAIAALVPANAAEAELAAQFFVAAEQSKSCLRLAAEPGLAPQWAGKCRTQGLAMMRQASSALRLLLRLQAIRDRRQADAASADRAAWTEHCAIGLMADALAGSPPAPAPEPQTAGPPSASPHPEPPPAPPTADPVNPDPVDPDLVAAAERYAALYPERAAAIRRTGKLPCDVRYFDPPEAALARVLITARIPALTALDALPEARAT